MATLRIPADAVATDTQFTIDVAQGAFPAGSVLGVAFEITPAGTVFAPNPAVLTISYDPAALAGVDPTLLNIGTLVNGTWVTVPGSSVDTTNHTVTVSLTHLSLYAIVLPGTPPAPNQPPIASASAGGPYVAAVNAIITLNAAGSVDPDNSPNPLTYTWNFGDGTSPTTVSTLQTTHAYNTAGTYTVTLTVSDGLANSDPATTSAEIFTPPSTNRPPIITSTGGPYWGMVNQALAVTATASDPDGDTLTYTWDFGDETVPSTSALSQTTHTYTLAGTFPITLTVTDSHGNTTVAAPTTAQIAAQPLTAHSQSFTISLRQNTPTSLGNSRYAVTLRATGGSGPLTYKIATFPAHQDPLQSMGMQAGTTYRRVDPITGEITSFIATTSTSIATDGTVIGSVPMIIYTPNICFVDGFLRDSFTFTVSDAATTAPPATVQIAVAEGYCGAPTF